MQLSVSFSFFVLEFAQVIIQLLICYVENHNSDWYLFLGGASVLIRIPAEQPTATDDGSSTDGIGSSAGEWIRLLVLVNMFKLVLFCHPGVDIAADFQGEWNCSLQVLI